MATADLIKKCCDIAKQYDGQLRIDGPDDDSDKFLVDIIGDDGELDDAPSGRDDDLNEALTKFIYAHEDDDSDDENDDD